MSVDPTIVVKIGGSLTREAGLRERLRPLLDLHARERALVVPGGGPLADAVRDLADRHGLDESGLHWMAVLALDQQAVLLSRLLDAGRVVHEPEEIGRALEAAHLPILAPSRWLSREDPLPHDRSVTSDSIAAWVARRLGVRKLLLVKSAPDRTAVDDYFAVASAGLECEIAVPSGSGWRRMD